MNKIMQSKIITILILLLSLNIIFLSLDPLYGSTGAEIDKSNKTPKNSNMLQLNAVAQGLFERNGFVVVPGKAYKDMNHIYMDLRRDNLPIFVTTDSILHTTHLIYDHLLKIIEFNHLLNDLKELTRFMLQASLDDYQTIKDPEVRKAVYGNIAFFSVAARLLQEAVTLPPDVTERVKKELKQIEEHEGFATSHVLYYLEDYSQYVPRGHYTRNQALQSYFKAMMWYSRMGFYLKPSTSLKINEGLARQLTRQALMIVKALNESNTEGGTALDLWKRIYEPTALFVGKTDDLNVYDYKTLAHKIYGKIPGNAELADDSKLDQFISAARNLRKPKILSTFVIDTEGRKTGAEKITQSFRFMGQRLVPDAHMFQNLVYPKVLLYTGHEKPFTLVMSQRGPIRGFPRGLDIMAVFGSVYAEEILKKEGDSDYEKYGSQLKKLKKEFDLKQEEWASNLYWNWLYCLKPLLSPLGDNPPSFMRGNAWAGKALNTTLGSWAELKHDTILYAKQSYTMVGSGIPPQPELTHGYVEPYPELYSRIRGMIERMRKGLVVQKLLDKRIEDNLIRYESILFTLEAISKKELANEPIEENEYKIIWKIGSQLNSVTRFPHEIISKIRSGTDDNMAVIADVHTDPNSGMVLEEAVGAPFIMFVDISADEKDRVARGPVFSYYEFKQPMSDRLTDEHWQKILKQGREPPLPSWSGDFVSK